MRRQYRAIFENLLCLAALALLPLYVFFPAVVRGQIPMALEGALFEAPWQEARPEGLTRDATPFAQVQEGRLYPSFAFISRSADERQSMLWNPYEAGGAPFLAAWQTRALSPFTTPFLVLPLKEAITWSFLAKLFFAGLCAYYVSRRFGFPAPFALFAGITYQLSGVICVWTAFPFADVAVWFPLLLMFAEQVALGQRRCWPIGALTIGLMALGGDPAGLVVSVVFAFVFILVRVVSLRDWKRLKSALPPSLGALLLGLGLAAVQILPYLEFLRERASADGAVALSLKWGDLAALLVPGIVGADRAGDAPLTALLHVGVLPVLAIAVWIALRGFVDEALRKRVEALLVTAAMFSVAGVVYGVDSFFGLGARCFLLANGLALAWMTAAALEEWQELNAEQIKSALARLSWLLPLLWGGLFIGSAAWFGRMEDPVRSWGGGLVVAGLAGLALLVVLAATLFRPSVRGAGYAVAFVTALSLLQAVSPSLNFTRAELAFPETAFIKELKQSGERINGSGGGAQWPLTVNGIRQFQGPAAPHLKRYDTFLDIIRNDPMMLRRAGSKSHLLSKQDIQGAFASVRPVLNIRKVFTSGAVLFDDVEAKPRAWMAYVWRPVENFDPMYVNWNRLPLIETTVLPEKSAAPDAEPSIDIEHANDAVRVHVKTPQRGVLVLADAWYPGWEVTVDGVAADSFPVDGFFRGVRLTDGEYDVWFRYRPAAFSAGLIITGLSALLLLYGLARLLLQRIKSVQPL